MMNDQVPRRTLGDETPSPRQSAPKSARSRESRVTFAQRARHYRRTQPGGWRIGDEELREHFSKMDTDPRYRMAHEPKELGHEFMRDIRKSDILRPNRAAGARTTDAMDGHQRMLMARMMAMMGGMPGMGGMGGQHHHSMIQNLTTAALFMTLSPEFRGEMKDRRDDVIRKIGERIDKRVEKKKGRIDARSRQRIEKYEKALEGNFEGREMKPLLARFEALRGDPVMQDKLLRSWERKAEALNNAERNGRTMLLTEQTAAQMKLGLAENAHDLMRERNRDGKLINDPESVMHEYRQAMQELERQCELDGVSREATERSMRIIVGERLIGEPLFPERIHGISHGQVRMDDPIAVRGHNGKMRQIWAGDFVDTGGQDAESRWFEPRQIQSMEEHVARLSHSMYYDTIRDPDLGTSTERVQAYAAASAMDGTHTLRMLHTSLEEGDVKGGAWRQALSFKRAMTNDGFSPEQIDHAYRSAMEQAVDSAYKHDGKLRSALESQYGRNWHLADSASAVSMRDRLREQFPLLEELAGERLRENHDRNANIEDAEVVDDDLNEPSYEEAAERVQRARERVAGHEPTPGPPVDPAPTIKERFKAGWAEGRSGESPDQAARAERARDDVLAAADRVELSDAEAAAGEQRLRDAGFDPEADKRKREIERRRVREREERRRRVEERRRVTQASRDSGGPSL